MNNLWKSVVLGLVVLLALLYYRHTQRPDVQIGSRLEKICVIAKAHATSPQKGVDALFSFFAGNTPELARDFGRLLVELGGIDDERAHDARAREAARTLWGPLMACQESLERFGDAIENDAAASKKLEAGANRVGRSLTILFGGEPEALKAAMRALHLHAQ